MNRNVRDIKRVSYIVNVLFKEGLGFMAQDLRHHVPLIRRLARRTLKEPPNKEVRIRRVFERLGGTYIKLGQLLSLRPDLIPQSYCDEFQKLQDEVPPFRNPKEVVEKELKQPIAKVFSHFDEKPLGSASIGQVHKAKLKDGTDVVVKVQRPKIAETMAADIDILYHLAQQLEKKSKYKSFAPTNIVREFERYTRDELDYLVEAKHAEHINRASKDIIIPKVYWKHSTGKILTLSYVKGRKLTELLRTKSKFDKKGTTKLLVNAIVKQVFEDGTFHADLHPGNILVSGKQVALIDFGIVGRLNASLRKKGLDLYIAIVEEDIDNTMDTLLKIGRPQGKVDKEALRDELEPIIRKWHGAPLKDIRVTSMMHQTLNLCVKHNLKMPVDLILLGKALVTLEGTCRQLDPDFDFVKHSKPYITRVLKRKISTKELMQSFVRSSHKFRDVIYEFPEQASSLIEAIKRGKVTIDIEDTDIRALGLEIDRSSNRMAYGLVMAALIVAGALVIQTGIAPLLFGYPVVAMVSFGIAAMIGILLTTSILLEGR